MTTLIVERGKVEVRSRGATLVITREGGASTSVPLHLVGGIVLYEGASFDARTVLKLAGSGASLTVLNARDPEQWASLGSLGTKDGVRRIVQCRLHDCAESRNRFSRRLILAKLRGHLLLLHRIRSARPTAVNAIHKAIETVGALKSRLDVELVDRSALLGIEGAASAAFWNGYRAVFAPALGFLRRTRRPPTDPVNAVLSLTYTMLTHVLTGELRRSGLDPAIGFYHEMEHGRPALACDLVEALRPAAEGWVWTLFQSRVLREEHFGRQNDACLLGKAGRKHYYEAFGSRELAWRKQARRVVELFLRGLRRLETVAPVDGGNHTAAEGCLNLMPGEAPL